MKKKFYALILSFIFISFLNAISANAAPPDEWHHQKTNLTSLKSGWSSNRHYAVPTSTDSHTKIDGCGLVQFELPPFFSTASFDRRKIKIALSLTTYLPGDSIKPQTGLEISSINPQWHLSAEENTQMTVQSGNYSKSFHMTAEPPNVWISPIEAPELGDMLAAFAKNKEGEIRFSSGESMPLTFGHIKSTLENFRTCLLKTKFADLPPFEEENQTSHFF
ncbi:hypothetical protein FAI41_05360 [Acetobacteraceae bacterium]|nr:hypothetical protein FAI41_05360 [Acetobacteraceae bacterium]